MSSSLLSRAAPDTGSYAGARALSPARYALTACATCVLAWAALFFLPTDPYQRHAALRSTDYIKGAWIYERLNFDPTPVDIAFLGSSRTMEGVDAATVEADLATDGVAAHVVNLALPSLGQDTPALLARMLAETKRPRIVFVETDYLVSRGSSPAFSLLATPQEALGAPFVVNEWLPANLLRIAARNLSLTWKRLTGQSAVFDPTAYRGAHWEDVLRVTGRDGRLGRARVTHMSIASFESEAAIWQGNLLRKSRQYHDWAWVELHYAETWQQRMLEALQTSGTHIVLLSMPPVGMKEPPFHATTLRQYGEFWALPDLVAHDHTLWDNPTHMNYWGAEAYSHWLARQLRDRQGPFLGTLAADAAVP